MLLSTRRYKDIKLLKSFKQRTFIEKLLFWKNFYYYTLVEVSPEDADYDKAPFQEVVVYVENTFKLQMIQ